METELQTIPKIRAVYYDTYANLPVTNLIAGDLGFATDRIVLYRWSGAAWQPVTIHSSSGTAANIPAAANLPDGSLYYETDTGLLKQVQTGAWATITSLGGSGAIYGDGSDGDITINANTTLTRDMYYNNLVISTTRILYTVGYRVYVKNTLGIEANAYIFPGFDVDLEGQDGGAFLGGNGGTGVVDQALGGSGNGGNGGVGVGLQGTSCNPADGGAGGAGGAGDGGNGGAAGTVTLFPLGSALAVTGLRGIVLVKGGAGGGGGGGSGINPGGGGGGAGNSVLFIACRILDNAGMIRSEGGGGGDGNAGGNTGGGGGGGGGCIILIYNILTALGTVVAGGGLGGAGQGTGWNGGNGNAGHVYLLPNV